MVLELEVAIVERVVVEVETEVEILIVIQM